MPNLIERHASKMVNVLSCFYRVVIQGTILSVCYAGAVQTLLHAREIRIFAYGSLFADAFRQSIRAHVDRVATEADVEVEYIKAKGILPGRSHSGDHRRARVITMFSVMEFCLYRP